MVGSCPDTIGREIAASMPQCGTGVGRRELGGRTQRTASLERTGRALPALNEPDSCGILGRTASLEHGGAAFDE